MKKYIWLILLIVLCAMPVQAQSLTIDTVRIVSEVKSQPVDMMDLGQGYSDLDDCVSYTTAANSTHTFGKEPFGNSYPPARDRNIPVIWATSSCVAADGLVVIRVPAEWNGKSLVRIEACHFTAGSSAGGDSNSVIDIRRTRAAGDGNGTFDMLTTGLSIDKGETDSADATAPAVINAAYADLKTGDVLTIDLTSAPTGTAPLGLFVTLTVSH